VPLFVDSTGKVGGALKPVGRALGVGDKCLTPSSAWDGLQERIEVSDAWCMKAASGLATPDSVRYLRQTFNVYTIYTMPNHCNSFEMAASQNMPFQMADSNTSLHSEVYMKRWLDLYKHLLKYWYHGLPKSKTAFFRSSFLDPFTAWNVQSRSPSSLPARIRSRNSDNP
jgi:hypothetical protein